MKKAFIASIFISGIIFLTGCEEKYSTEWYISHHNELIAKYTECLLEKSWSSDKLCQNVRVAMDRERKLNKEDIEIGYRNALKKLDEQISAIPVPDLNHLETNKK